MYILTVQNHRGNEKAMAFKFIKTSSCSSCTISDWLKKTLKQTGINTDLFKAYYGPVWVMNL